MDCTSSLDLASFLSLEIVLWYGPVLKTMVLFTNESSQSLRLILHSYQAGLEV